MVTSNTQKVQAILRDRYPKRFKELRALMKSRHPFTGDKDSYRDVTRYNSTTYNYALKALSNEYIEEYVIEMRRFNPSYQKTLGSLATVKIDIYPDSYFVTCGRNVTASFTRISEVSAFVSDLLKELNK